MIKLLFVVLFALLSVVAPAAERSRGVYSNYDFERTLVDVPEPKGYTTFYVTHYGRHGARHINREYEYDALVKVLGNNALTPLGERIKARFDELYPQLKGRATDLTAVGREQHRRLAERLYHRWPHLFGRGSRVEAHSSDIPRCVLSMYSFLGSLEACSRHKVQTFGDVNSALVPLLKKPALKRLNLDSLFNAHFDIRPLYARLFVRPEEAQREVSVRLFTQSLYYFWAHLPCVGIEGDTVMQSAFTDAEAAALADIDDRKFRYHCGWGEPINVATSYPLLEDFISRAEADIAAGTPAVRLRFGHDNTLKPLAALMELPPFDASNIRSEVTPMAANLRWVFARNKSGHIIVKAQYNESDVTPWCDWQEFREAMLVRCRWARRMLDKPAVQHTVYEKNTTATPLYSAHRGLLPYGPENSFASFEAAADNNMWAIETDFHITRDSVVVCLHDATLERTTTGTGRVIDHTLAELRRLEVKPVAPRAAKLKLYNYDSLTPRQRRIPTLDEYLCICRRGGCVAFFELKEDNGVVKRLVQAIEKYGMEGRCVVSSGQLDLLKAYRAAGGKELIHKIGAKPEHIPALIELGNAALAFNYPDLSVAISRDINGHRVNSLKELVDYCHSLGLKICFRAIDTPEATRQALELGIDYLPTNTMWNYKP